MAEKMNFKQIPLSEIEVITAWNARSGDFTANVGDNKEGSSWEGFALDILENGVKDPVDVRPNDAKGAKTPYVLVTGFRRFKAAQAAKLETIPAVVHQHMTEADARLRNIEENTARENLRTPDLAWACYEAKKSGLNDSVIAAKIALTPAYVGRLNKIWDNVPSDISKDWRKSTVSITVNDMLTVVDSPKERQREVFDKIVQSKVKKEGDPKSGKNAWIQAGAKQVEKQASILGTLIRIGMFQPTDSKGKPIGSDKIDCETLAFNLVPQYQKKLTETKAVSTHAKFAKACRAGLDAGLSDPDESEEVEDEEGSKD